jgi:DNA-binding winged helix-turn-helix (wHTH) protein
MVAPPAQLRVSNVLLDDDACKVYVDGADTFFQPMQYRVLRALMQNAGRALTRDQLLDICWRDKSEHLESDRTIDVCIHRIRAKGVKGIKTVPAVGYRMDDISHPGYSMLEQTSVAPDLHDHLFLQMQAIGDLNHLRHIDENTRLSLEIATIAAMTIHRTIFTERCPFCTKKLADAKAAAQQRSIAQ